MRMSTKFQINPPMSPIATPMQQICLRIVDCVKTSCTIISMINHQSAVPIASSATLSSNGLGTSS